MKIEKMFKIELLNSVSERIAIASTFVRSTWPCVVYNFGQVKKDRFIKLEVALCDPEEEPFVFQRDFWAQKELLVSNTEIWRAVEAVGSKYTTTVSFEGGMTNGNTNNLQFCFLRKTSFCNVAVTVQCGKDGNLYVILQKTWHGKIFRDNQGKVRAPDVERKEHHPLNTFIINEYTDDDLPSFPEHYALWAEKIHYGKLSQNQLVVIAMDDGLNGGTYYCRNQQGRFQKVIASQLESTDCLFPTVGTILCKKVGGGWQMLLDTECEKIFFGPLDFKPDKAGETRLLDLREKKTVLATNFSDEPPDFIDLEKALKDAIGAKKA